MVHLRSLSGRLTHGVTVALQILVLSVKVRILMGQHFFTVPICFSIQSFRTRKRSGESVFEILHSDLLGKEY